MIFAMGAGDRLVGVGNFDRFPPGDRQAGQRVGGLLDPGTRSVYLALKPDLVIVYNTQADLKARLDRAGVPGSLFPAPRPARCDADDPRARRPSGCAG